MATQPQIVEETKPNQPEQEVDPKDGQLKFIFRYQPRDSEGQFIGKPYKYFYTDHADLARQLAEGKEHGDRFIHEVKTGKRKLEGEPAKPQADYKPTAPASEDDAKRREQIRKDLEAELGAPLDVAREDIKRSRQLQEYIVANTWAQNNDDYYACLENARMLDSYIKEKKWAMTAANLDLAFDALKDKLIPPPQEQASADSTQQPPATQPKPQSTGIIPGQFAGARQPMGREAQPLTRERFREINRMSRDQWVKLERLNPKEAEAFLKMKHAQPQQ
jgi:hypothetical protein